VCVVFVRVSVCARCVFMFGGWVGVVSGGYSKIKCKNILIETFNYM